MHLHLLVDTSLKLNAVFDITLFKSVQASGRDKFTFELKWYITLCDIVIFEEPAVEPRENSPPNILALKSQACIVRDQILWDERSDDKVRSCHICTIYINLCVLFDISVMHVCHEKFVVVQLVMVSPFCAVCSLLFSHPCRTSIYHLMLHRKSQK